MDWGAGSTKEHLEGEPTRIEKEKKNGLKEVKVLKMRGKKLGNLCIARGDRHRWLL